MKTFLSLVALAVLLSTSAFAQPAATEGVSAIATTTVTLGAGLVVAGNDGDWGTLSPGTSYTITPNGLISPPELANADGTVPQPMFWEITTEAGGLVDIAILLPSYFVGETFGARINYSASSQSGGVFFEEPAIDIPYEPFDPRVARQVLVSNDASTFIGLGGIVQATTGTPTEDAYFGTFILTASYSGF